MSKQNRNRKKTNHNLRYINHGPRSRWGDPVCTGSYTVKVVLKKMIPHILPIHGLKVKCTYNGARKQCKNCYEYHREKRREEITNKKLYTCEKKSFDQYVEIFKDNNPLVLKSILDYQNQKAENEGDLESKSELLKEIYNIKDDMVDYNFYNKHYLQ